MAELRVLFIGAGAVNFGGAEGPWDHSRRLEGEGGVLIVAIADPDTPKAEQVQLSGRASAAVLMPDMLVSPPGSGEEACGASWRPVPRLCRLSLLQRRHPVHSPRRGIHR